MEVRLIKSTLPPELWETASTLPGERPWPIAPARIAAWSMADATHARALRIKAEGVAGSGFAGRDAQAAMKLLGGQTALIEIALDLETYGNAFLERVVDKRGRLQGLRRLPAWSMARLESGGWRQRLWTGQQETRTDFAPDAILWIRQPTAQPGWYGVPDWAAAAGVIELLDAITRYNTRFFAHNAVPDHVVKHTGGALSDAQKEAIRDFFQTEFKGLSNARKTLFVSLPEGQTLDIQAVAQPNDGKFIELYKVGREVLPAAHGVPPRLLGIATPGALGGLSEAREQMHMFETFTLAPRRRLLIEALRPALGDAGLADIDLAAPDLTPPGADIQALPALVQAGIMTPDEARAWIDLPQLAAQLAKGASADLDADVAAALLAAMRAPSPARRGAVGEDTRSGG